MDRLLQSVPGTLRATLYSGSTATDPSPDSATLQVIRADGTNLIAPGQVVTNDGTGMFSHPLTPTQTNLLDRLTARWTMTVGAASTIVTTAEIVGGYICSLAELKPLFPSNTDAELAAIRTAAEQRLESACRKAFVPRYSIETRSARRRFRLAWPYVRAIRFAEINGTNVTPAVLAGLSVTPTGEVMGLPTSSTGSFTRIKIGYEHGEDYPSEAVREGVTLVAQETFNTDVSEGLVIRREVDNNAVTFASPTSSGQFLNPTLRRIVRDNAAPLVV